MRLVICENSADVADMVASYVVKRINDYKPTEARPFVHGCPTGSSPLITYKRLVELYTAGKVSFKHVKGFNMAYFYMMCEPSNRIWDEKYAVWHALRHPDVTHSPITSRA